MALGVGGVLLLLAGASPGHTVPPHAAPNHLRYMTVYGWETTLSAGMRGWVNLAKGPVANRSLPKPTLQQQIHATLRAQTQLGGAPILWGLPPGVIAAGATSLPAG